MDNNLLLYETLKYDEYLKSLLQKNISLSVDGKILRKGYLLLYSYKNFSIQFLFKTENSKKPRKTEIPIPFEITTSPNNKHLLFRYNTDIITEDKVTICASTDNKYLNNTITIRIE